MKERSIIIPCFKHSEVNKSGKFTPEQSFNDNLLEALKQFNEAHSDEDMLIIASKEKMDDGDYRMGIACVSYDKQYDTDIICIEHFGFKKLPGIFINMKRGVIDVIKKTLCLKAFW